jgi:Arc/MetJ-type ribon-helix-helix transcriptional regulator
LAKNNHIPVWQNIDMKTVQLTLDEILLEHVDALVKRAGTTRSDFIREALRHEIKRHENERLEQEHRASFERDPQNADETGMPSKRAWGGEGAAQANGLDVLKAAFANLEPNARRSLIDEAQTWARAKTNAPTATGSTVSREEISKRFPTK